MNVPVQNVRAVLSPFISRFNRHHDELSVQRQRTLATLQLLVNLLVVVLYEVAITAWDWRFTLTPPEKTVAWTVWALSLLCLGFSSSLYATVTGLIRSLSSRPQHPISSEPAALSMYRKYVYYPGVYLNVVAIAIFVEASGGIVHSPFSAVLFALVLAAQQLSRFKTNSLLFISFGVVTTIVLSGVESLFGVHRVATPPAALYFWTLAGAFLLTALCTHSDKGENYRARGAFPAPSLVELYVDDEGTWRFALHCAGARLDPVVETPTESASLPEAQHIVEGHVARMLAATEDGEASIRWRVSRDRREALGYISET
jgi:hypothetical protein